MLKQLSRLKHTRNILIVGFVVFMAVSLVIFYKPGNSGTEPSKNTSVLAKVGRDEITVAELATQKQAMAAQYNGIDLSQLGYTDELILDQLVAERATAQLAEAMGFRVGDAELEELLAKEFSDPTGKFLFVDASGKRDVKKYTDRVTALYGSVEQYEEGRRRSYETQKLRAFVTASVTIADDEVWNDYNRKNTSFDLAYAVVSAEKLAEKVQPTDADLRAYYEQHKTDFRFLVAQKRIRYVFIDQDKAGEKLQVTDKDLKDEFAALSGENKQAGVKVQQIVFKVAASRLDADQEEKAKKLIATLRGKGGEVSEEAFAEAARGNSEDLATSRNGGSLARLIKKNPNKPDGLYDRAVDMQPGDISDIPIKFGGNWYILRRGVGVDKTFEEAKAELLPSWRNHHSYDAARKLADRAHDSLLKSHDPAKVAQELAADANMTAANMVRDTGYVKPGDDVKDIGTNQQFEQAIASLNNANDVGPRTGIKGGFAIPMLTDKKDPRLPEFDEIKDKVTQAFKQQRAKDQLEQKARELASGTNNAADLKAAAEKAGLESATEEAYKLGSAVGKAGTSPALDDAIFALQEGALTKAPIKVGDNWVVVGATKRKAADKVEFAKQKAQLTETMLRTRQNQVFGDYISGVIEKMKHDGKIKIYKEILAGIQEDAPAAPQRRPRFPAPRR
jgi:peptidyl-prolyl cis-trans isomerase D